ncbi:MAG: hypothetical protein AMS21_11070 [Gemmatimonas sp. SG8_38_2]|nr:MAG: hypothetical protein AMS21_11070 [Gemmatimonas sp. SG8_38_2]
MLEGIMKMLGRASISWVVKLTLDIAWYATLVLAVLVAVDVLGGVVGVSAGRLDLAVRFELDPGSYRVTSEAYGVEQALVTDAVGKLVFGSTNVSLLFLYFGVLLVWFGAALAIIYELRQVFRTLVDGEPFVRANAVRIHLIGMVIILMEIVRLVILTLFSVFVRDNFSVEGVTLGLAPRPDLGVILVGLVVLVIASVFRQGTELREEQELTV